jgi:hypothetical protein
MTEAAMTDPQFSGALLILTGIVPMWLLAYLVAVRKYRSLVNGVQWERVADPDRLLRRIGGSLFFLGALFVALGTWLVAGTPPQRLWTLLQVAGSLAAVVWLIYCIVSAHTSDQKRGHGKRS